MWVLPVEVEARYSYKGVCHTARTDSLWVKLCLLLHSSSHREKRMLLLGPRKAHRLSVSEFMRGCRGSVYITDTDQELFQYVAAHFTEAQSCSVGSRCSAGVMRWCLPPACQPASALPHLSDGIAQVLQLVMYCLQLLLHIFFTVGEHGKLRVETPKHFLHPWCTKQERRLH